MKTRTYYTNIEVNIMQKLFVWKFKENTKIACHYNKFFFTEDDFE